MSTPIELDEKRRTALERVARLRKVPLRRLLERAVDEFIERAEDEELLESSARVARRTGLREKDAVEIVREWRRSDAAKRKS
jgi:predicted DNA-binding ribbon-helix-helix protein